MDRETWSMTRHQYSLYPFVLVLCGIDTWTVQTLVWPRYTRTHAQTCKDDFTGIALVPRSQIHAKLTVISNTNTTSQSRFTPAHKHPHMLLQTKKGIRYYCQVCLALSELHFLQRHRHEPLSPVPHFWTHKVTNTDTQLFKINWLTTHGVLEPRCLLVDYIIYIAIIAIFAYYIFL